MFVNDFVRRCCSTYILTHCIPGLRGSASRHEPVAEPVTISSSCTLPALITESEHVGDDWLIDDVRGSKRKRPDVDSLLKDIHTEKKRNRPQPSYCGRTAETSRVRDIASINQSEVFKVAEVAKSTARTAIGYMNFQTEMF